MTDQGQARAIALQQMVSGTMNGVATAACVRLGDRLGLHRAMAGQGPLSAGDLAARTGLNERFLLEWLRQQTTASLIVENPPGRFELDTAALQYSQTRRAQSSRPERRWLAGACPREAPQRRRFPPILPGARAATPRAGVLHGSGLGQTG